MNVCDNCGNRFEYKSSESLQSTLIKGFNNAMVMDQDDMYTCKECGQMFDIWRIEHELHRDPEEVLNDHLQGHGLQLPEGSLESHATEDYPPAPPEGKKHCPRCGGSGEIDKDIYGQSIGGIYECERCNGDGLVNESYAKEDWLDEDDDEEDYTPAVSVEEAVSILKEYPDGLTGLEWSKKVRERHGGGSASFRQAELQGLAYMIDSRTGERSTWGDKWVASESYAKEDSLVKIEDNNDDDTQVTVLDEWENETDPDVGGKTEDINATEIHLSSTYGRKEHGFYIDGNSAKCSKCGWVFSKNDGEEWQGLARHEEDHQMEGDQFNRMAYEPNIGHESKATEFDYNKWENAEDGNVLVPDEDLKEIKDLEKQLDGENVCPECGDKTDDDKEFEDHLNAHRFEEEV